MCFLFKLFLFTNVLSSMSTVVVVNKIFSCFSTYELQKMLDYVVPTVVYSVPDSSLQDFVDYASTILQEIDISYDFENIPIIVSDDTETLPKHLSENFIVYLENDLFEKCLSKQIFRIFPELENQVKDYCDNKNISYNEFTHSLIYIFLQTLYNPITPISTIAPSTIAPTPSITTYKLSSSSNLKVYVKSTLVFVTVIYML